MELNPQARIELDITKELTIELENWLDKRHAEIPKELGWPAIMTAIVGAASTVLIKLSRNNAHAKAMIPLLALQIELVIDRGGIFKTNNSGSTRKPN